jgi:hypothetical protein
MSEKCRKVISNLIFAQLGFKNRKDLREISDSSSLF